MPTPKQDLPMKDSPKGAPPEGQNKKNIPQKQAPPAKTPSTPKPPAQEKDDVLKYDMQYANGGFNNGVEIKPDKDGKVQLKISIYGGGEQKVMKISPLPDSVAKLIKAYEITATQNDNSTPEITEELQQYFDRIRTILSSKIIQIVKRMDAEIKSAIEDTFTQIQKKG